MLDAMSIRMMNQKFTALPVEKKREFLHYILADDLGTILSSVLKFAAPKVLNYAWNKIKNTRYGQKAVDIYNDYFAADSNDDAPLKQAVFSIQPHQNSWIQSRDVTYRYDAVNS